jgi:hypothetical protein
VGGSEEEEMGDEMADVHEDEAAGEAKRRGDDQDRECVYGSN